MTPARPRLRRSVDPRLTVDGTLYVLRGPDLSDLELAGPTPALVRLIELADGSRAVERLIDELSGTGARPEELREAIEQLAAAGVLDDAAEETVLGEGVGRHERQLAYFADMTGSARAGVEVQRRLAGATVGLLGLGGLGTWTAWGLACAGVGTRVGVDGDRVERSNLNRQILYGEDDLGRAKVEVAAERLRSFHRALDFRPVDRMLEGTAAVAEVVRGCDFVVDSLDHPPHRITRSVARACFAVGVPYLALSQHPPMMRVGPLYAPGRTGCHLCQEARYRREFPLFEALARSRPLRPPSATFGPACGVVGALASNEVVAWLSGLHPPACLGRAALIDLRTLAVEWEPVAREPGCEVCGGAGGG